jgi:DNA-binding NarL/FixJ family response regulator
MFLLAAIALALAAVTLRTVSLPRWLASLRVLLALLAAGTPNPRIAEQLVVTLDTVKKHVSHLLGKLGAANRTEAVTRARQLGLIP